jgi:N-acylneuraminate cytidylyltransferase
MIVAIIPARIGSKRIKKKNIKLFLGRPIISYSIKSAQKSKIFDKIIVSTDSNIIGNIAKKYGAEFLFKRPKSLSGDSVNTRKVILHAIKWLSKNFKKPNIVCCIYPTAPLMSHEDLIKSFKKIKSKKWNYIFSATKNSFPIERCFFLNKKNKIIQINKNNFFKKSQFFKPTYRDAGQFYWGTYHTWVNKSIIFEKNSSIYQLSNLRTQDIDNIEDWKAAEQLYRINNKI